MGKEGVGGHTAVVRAPDGEFRTFPLSKKDKGEALFCQVTKDLSIEEKEYFSLCFYDRTGVRHWLYNDKAIGKQLKDLPWEFSYEVKFFPTQPTALTDESARFNLYQQLKKDILVGRLAASSEAYTVLGGLQVQAEIGDVQQSAEYENYLQTTQFSPSPEPGQIDKIRQEHHKHKGQTQDDAILGYLDACKQLPMYGVFLFPAKDNKNHPVTVGISSFGINIYREQARLHSFAWQYIVKIRFRNHGFHIDVKPGQVHPKKVSTVSYTMATHHDTKRCWKCGVEHHTFFRLIQPEETPSGVHFSFGSSRFGYHGRTQFQTKMASQLFDRPGSATVTRSGQPLAARGTQSMENVNAADDAVHHQAEHAHRSFTAPDARQRKRDIKVGELMSDEELVYLPVQSPLSAAYYTQEPLTVSAAAASRGGAAVRFAQEETPRGTGTRKRPRRLFGRDKAEGSGAVLLSAHLPANPEKTESLERQDEIPDVPIGSISAVYSKGYYATLPTQTTAKPSPDELGRQGELAGYPIRYFVDVQHSGSSERYRTSRLRHTGSEDTNETLDYANYLFPTIEKEPVGRLEKSSDLPATHLAEHVALKKPQPTVPRKAHKRKATKRGSIDSDSSSNSISSDSKERQVRKPDSRLLAFLRNISPRKSRDSTTQSSQYHYISTDRYDGPMQSIPRHLDIGHIPIPAVEHVEYPLDHQQSKPQKEARQKAFVVIEEETKTTKRFFLFGRTRHEGEEEVADIVDPYNLDTTAHEGPLDDLAHEKDLEGAPLAEHATAYHHGESWRKSKKEASPVLAVETPEETQRTAVVYLKEVPQDEQPEVAETSIDEKKKRGFGFHLPSLKFGSKKGSKDISHEEPYPSTSDKYEGPLDEVDRENDLEKLPLEAQPSEHKETKTTKRFFLFGRTRHEGEEEVADIVDPYNLDTTAHQGPLDDLAHEKDLEGAPLAEHATAYHHGESWRKSKKEASPVLAVETPEETQRTAVVYLKEVPQDGHPEVAEASIDEKKKRGFGFHLPSFKIGGKKGSKDISHEEPYPSTSDKYEGPLDEVDPQPSEHKETKTTKRFFLFGRTRHEGEEEVADIVDPYNLDTTAHQGPLDDLAHEKDLEGAPLAEHATAYHHGESWRKSKKEASPVLAVETPEETQRTAVVYLKEVPQDGHPEVAEASIDEKKKRGFGFHLPSFKIGGKKGSKDISHEEPYPSTSDKYEGPLDEVDREHDLEKLPLEAQPSEHKETKTTKRFFLFGRTRHEGEEEVADVVDPYNLDTTAHEGPLDDLAHEKDLEGAPLAEHATAYHHGESWRKSKKEASPVLAVETPEETQRTAVVYLKEIPQDEQPEVAETSIDEKKKRGFGFHLPSLKFGSKKGSKDISHEEPYPSTSDKYEGPLDEVDRENDLEKLPLEAQPSEHKETTTTKRFFLFGRTRHEGEEEVADIVDPYNLDTTAHEGPLADLPREQDLEGAPLAEHATAYHRGESWRKSKKEASPVLAVETPGETQRTAVVYLKEVPQDEQPEVAETSIDEKKKRGFGFHLPSFKIGGKKGSKDINHEEPYPSTSDKYEGPLDEVDRENDLEKLPLEAQSSEHKETKTTKRFFLFGRTRHEGEEEVADIVDPYNLDTTAHEGPLDDLSHEKDLEGAPLAEHATAYHHGESWRKSKKEASPVLAVETPEETQRTAVVYLKEVPQDEQPEVAETSIDEKKKRGFGFDLPSFKIGGKKGSKDISHEEPYPTTSDKYEGPLDEVDRENDLEKLPLEAQPSEHKETKTTKRFFLFGRTRHEGEEEVADIVDPYNLDTTAHEGPLADLPREQDLEGAPLAEHATAYHHGESWRKSKKEASPVLAVETPEETQRTAVVYLKEVPQDGHPEVAETSIDEKKKRGFGFHLPSFKIGGKKGSKDISNEEPYPSTSDKSEGPLDEVDRENDLEKLPLEAQPSEHKETKTTTRFFLFGRTRHEGEEEVADIVDPYNLDTTAHEGPLADLPREQDLEGAPLAEHATAYHHGESWRKSKKEASPVLAVETPEETQRTAVVYLKEVPQDEQPEVAETSIDEKKKRGFGFHLPSLKFGSKKGSKDINHEEPYPSTSDKYEGPLDEVDRENDLEKLPLEAQPSEHKETKTTKRFFLFGRTRHEGEEEVADIVDPYNLDTTAHEGPLADLPREQDLEGAPLAEHATAYHHGESWRKSKKEASPVLAVETPEETQRTAVVYLKEVPQDGHPEVAETSIDEKKKRGFGFHLPSFKIGGKKGSKDISNEEPYPSTSDKSEGPLDEVDRENDLEKLPLEAQPSEHKETKTTTRFFLFGRTRHEGEEEVADIVDPYNLDTTAHEGPLADLPREQDLEGAPLAEHATAYHHGESWRKSKKEASPVLAVETPEETQRTAVVYLKEVPQDEQPEVAETSIDEKKKRGFGFHLPSLKFGSKKGSKDINHEEPYPSTSDKYEGPLDEVDRENDLEKLPLEAQSSEHKETKTTKRFFLFGRTRHEGEEEVADIVDPYNLDTTAHEGPLDDLSHEKDLEGAPLAEHATAYHHGESWRKSKKEASPVLAVETPEETQRTAVVYLKEVPQDEQPEVAETSIDEKKKRGFGFHLPSLKFGSKKGSKDISNEEPYPSTSDKYEGPLDEVDRENDLEKLPLEAQPSEHKETKTTKRFFLFGRTRHEGEEEVADIVDPYNLDTTAHEGPLADLPREQDLEGAPLAEHATAYHHGESWRKSKKEASPVLAVETPEETQRTAVVYLKEVPQDEQPEVAETSIDEKKKRGFGFHLPSLKFGSKKGSKDINHEEPYPSTSDKYEGPLDEVDRENDLEKLPLEAQSSEHKETKTTKRFFLFGRTRHEGEEEVADIVDPYNLDTTAHEGPLDDLSHEKDLEGAPLAEHATAYHHGESWRKSKKEASPVLAVETPEETQRTAVVYLKEVPQDEQPEVAETSIDEKKKRGFGFHLPSLKFGSKKGSKDISNEEPYPSTSDKYEGPLDEVDRENDLEKLPLEAQPSEHKETKTTKRFFLFGRTRHEGEEEVADIVDPYNLDTTAHEGPLADLPREQDLEGAPLAEHATAYHHGESWLKSKKEASPVLAVETPEETQRTAVVYLKEVPQDEQPEVAETSIDEKKKRGFGFRLPSLKFGSKKGSTDINHEEPYPSTSDKYEGPLDEVDRENDLEKLPLEAQSSEHKETKTTKRFFLFGRTRHEGEEEVADIVDPYNLDTTAHEGPLDDLSHEKDLEGAPLAEHATAYHHGESWRKSKKEASPVLAVETPEETQRTAVVYLKEVPQDEQPEVAETSIDEKKKRGFGFHLPSLKFGSKKGSKDISHEEPYPSTSDKYEGPLDEVDRENDLEKLPLEAQSSEHKETKTTKRFFLFGRTRHEGEEEVADIVDPYNLDTTAHEGPLDDLSHEKDLEGAPLAEHATAYHHGESWRKSKKEASPVLAVETPEETQRTAVVYLKEVPQDEQPEVAQTSIDEKKKRGFGFHLPSLKFGSKKGSKDISNEEPYPSTSDKYEGPLDEVDRENDLEKLPLEAQPSEHKETKTTKRFFLFGRTRHEGEEEVADIVDPYNLDTTAHEGPLADLPREQDLEGAPLAEHATAYHHGESWRKSKKEASPVLAVETPEETQRTAVVYLKEVPQDEQPEVAETSIDEKKKRGFGFHLPSLKFGSKKGSKDINHEEPYPSTSDKYEGSLDEVDPSTRETKTTKRFFLFGRTRHEGEEEVADIVDPYNLDTTAHEGPLDDLSHEKDLEGAPLAEHATAYHHGESWRKSKKEASPVLATSIDEKKKRGFGFHLPSLKFGSKKGSKDISNEEPYPSTSDKYEGPLDEVDRENDLEKLPLEAQPSEHKETKTTKRFFLFGRTRHEGEEEVADIVDPYNLDTTAHEGPLADLPREQDLEGAPLAEHATAYHHGESWLKSKKEASPVLAVETPEETQRTAVVYLKEVPQDEQPEVAETSIDEKKKRGFGFHLPSLNFGSKKGSKDINHEEPYPSTSDKYEGPLDEVDRENDLEKLPLEAQSSEHKETKTTKRFFLFGRTRHEGEEEVADIVDPYNLDTTAHEGPLDDLSHEKDLEGAPLAEHATAYHHGESWRKSKKEASPVLAVETPEETQRTAVVYLKEVPQDEQPEVAETSIDEKKKRGFGFRLPSLKFGSKKGSTDINHEEPYPSTSDKYEGPLDEVDRENDLEKLPLEAQSSEHKETKTTKRFFLFGRTRHEGEEEVADIVDPYNLDTTAHEGPLDDLSHEKDLEGAPLAEHATAYHPGESWRKSKKEASPVLAVETPEETQRTAVVYLKEVPQDEQPEVAETSIDEKKKRGFGFHLPSLNFGSKKGSKDINHEEPYPSTSDKYEGPLDEVDRENDLEKLPLEAQSSEHKETKTTKRFFLFGRTRHEGEEEVADIVDPYNLDTTAHEGPLDDLSHEKDLEGAPLAEHATAYHHGESWRKSKKEASPVLAVETPEETQRTAVVYLKEVPQDEQPEVAETSIDEKKKRGFGFHLPSLKFGSKKGSKDISHEEPYPSTSDNEHKETKTTKRFFLFGRTRHEGEEEVADIVDPYNLDTTAHEGPLDDLSHEKDLEGAPLAEHATAYHHGESWRKSKKEASPVLAVETPEETQRTAVVYLKEVPQDEQPEVAETSIDEKKKRGFGFHLPSLKFGSKKGSKDISNEEPYPSTSDKYEGPLDEVDRENDLEKLPLEAQPSEHKETKTTKRFFLFGRTRHEGEEEVADIVDPYNLDTTAHEGPLADLPREQDLEGAPLAEHATAYHHGESWRKSKKEASPVLAVETPEETQRTAVVYLKEVPQDEQPEVAETSIDEKKKRGFGFRLPSLKFGSKKGSTDINHEEPYPSTSDKYEGPLDEVDRENDLEKLPLEAQSSEHKETKTTKRFFLFGRTRHEGEEEVADIVDPYNLDTTAHEGPLDDLSHEKDLEGAPLAEHATAYHHGESWRKSKKEASPVLAVETPEETQRTAVVYLKEVPQDEQPEVAETSIDEKKKRGFGFHLPSLKFGSKKGSKDISNEEPYPSTSDKYEGPLDEVDRENDLEKLPLEAQPSEHKETKTTKRFFLFGRTRHEGEEEVADIVDPYNLDTTAHEGPLADLPREQDLEGAPLAEHATAYHHGESWRKSKKEASPVLAVETPEETQRTAVVYLKEVPQDEQPEVAETSIDEKKKRGFGFHLPSLKSLIPRLPDKYEGPLDEVDRENDLEKLPLEAQSSEHKETKTTKRFFLFGRTRHEGEEEVADIVDPYNLDTTAHEGPLDDLSHEKDLEGAPLAEHATAYHHGESWRKSKKEASPVLAVETPEETQRTAVVYLKEVPQDEQPEVAETSIDEKKKRGFGFHLPSLKFGSKKGSKDISNEEPYPSTSDKYEGPLDEVDRENDLEKLPLEAQPSEHKETKTTKRFFLFGRTRHEGEEEVADIVDPYNLDTTAHEGPLADLPREQDLEGAPLAEHATAYHHGESWRKSKKEASPVLAVETPEETQRTAVVYLKEVPQDEQPEVAETSIDEKKKRGFGFHLPSLKFGSKKGSKDINHEEPYPSTSDKYEGPLDEVDRENDLEKLPLEAQSSEHKETKTTKRFFLFGRTRHEGEEEVADIVDPYNLDTTAHEGPLDDLSHEKDLEGAPLAEHATAYHHGESWRKSKKEESPVLAVETPEEPQRTAVVYLKEVPQDEQPEVAEISIDEKKKRSFGFHLPSLKFGSKKGSKDISHEEPYPSTSDKYDGPLDEVDRENDLEKLPIGAETSAEQSKQERGKEGRRIRWSVSLPTKSLRIFERLRHGGEEEVADPVAQSYQVPVIDESVDTQLGYSNMPHSELAVFPKLPSERPVLPLVQRLRTFARLTHAGHVEFVEREQIDWSSYPGTTIYEGEYDLTALNPDLSHSVLNTTCSPYHPGEYQRLPSLPKYTPTKSYQPQLSTEADKSPVLALEPLAELESRLWNLQDQFEGTEIVEVRIEKRCEIELHPQYTLEKRLRGGAGGGVAWVPVSSPGKNPEKQGTDAAAATTAMPAGKSLLQRLGLAKAGAGSTKDGKQKKSKKGHKGQENTVDTSSTSSDSEEEKALVVVRQTTNTHASSRPGAEVPPQTMHYTPADASCGVVIREEKDQTTYRLTGKGLTPHVDPKDPESGQPHTTVQRWQETNIMPDQVVQEVDDDGHTVTRTIKTSQVKSTVQKQTFQNFTIPEDENGVSTVERVHEQVVPRVSPSKQGKVYETHTRTVAYENGSQKEQELPGEFVSSKTVTSGNRTVETVTYKTERDGVVETHVEHRVTIHSDDAIDHDAELSRAIMEATQSNPEMTVEKIEVVQEAKQ
ncbi:unnamed protein product, partial [Mesorhabditis spiculigera]